MVWFPVINGFGIGLGKAAPSSSKYDTLTSLSDWPFKTDACTWETLNGKRPSLSLSHSASIVTRFAIGNCNTVKVICAPKPKQSLAIALSTLI